jgi:hypothetical protein
LWSLRIGLEPYMRAYRNGKGVGLKDELFQEDDW